MNHRLFLSQKILITALALASLFAISGCSGAKEFTSSWTAQQIQIDGKNNDWQGNVQTFAEEKYSIGFTNDSKFLYLCFTTSDRQKIGTVMRSGISVSFESATDSKKDYTIRFPLTNPNIYRETVSSLGAEALQKESVGFLYQGLLDKQLYFSLIQDEFMNSISLVNKENIEAKAGLEGENLVLELKAPLAATESAFPIGVLPGEEIRIKFTIDSSPAAFRTASELNQSSPGAQASGGRGGSGSAGADAGGDSGGAGPVNVKESFSVKCSVKTTKGN